MSNFFGHKVELLFGGYKITNDLDITFDVEFDDGPDINVSEVKIYNLSDSTINKMKKNMAVTLNAGYINDYGNILSGKIQLIKTEWQGPDKLTTITIADIADGWLDKNIDKTYKNDVAANQILIDAIKVAGLRVGEMSLPTNKIYKGGKTIKGTIGKTISEIVPDCNAKWHYTSGAVYVTGKNEGTATKISIDKSSGLIETPTPYTKTESYKVNKTIVTYETANGKRTKKVETQEDDKTRTLNGYKLKVLLNHRIKTDSIIEIKSLSAKGNFRVAVGKHDGDAFVTELEVYAV